MDKSKRSSSKINQEPPQKNHEVLQRKEIFVREEKSFQKCSTSENAEQHYSDRKQHFNNDGIKNEQSKKLTNESARELGAKDRNYQNRNTDKTRRSNHYEWNKDNNYNKSFNKRASNENSEGRKAERAFNFDSRKKNSCQQPLMPHRNISKNGNNMENKCNIKKNMSTDELGIHDKSESYLEDSLITTPGISDRVPVRNPNSSNLNPNASSFYQNCEFNTIDNAKDIINSSELETFSDTHEMRKNLPPTNIDTQIEAGAIKKTANVSKIRSDKKKRVKDDLPSTASHYKHKVETRQRSIREDERRYSSGVLSYGSTSRVDQNISQTSDLALDCNESSNQNYQINQKVETNMKGRFRHRSSFENNTLDNRLRNIIYTIFQPLVEDKDDDEAEELLDYIKSPKAGTFLKVTEQEKDLFSVGEDYSLAHCVAEDMSMGSGIAVEFRRRFNNVLYLLNMRKKSGGLAVWEVDSRYIYYMVTKKISTGKPTYSTFWKSLKKLRDHIKENKVEKLAIPRIGCGLDRLDWDIVKILLEFLFRELDVFILVCNLQQEEYFSSSPNIQRSRKCKIVRENYAITDIDHGTIIIYFASADGQSTPTMMQLNEKFMFLKDFNRSNKNLGDVIRLDDKRRNYILCGCIVKQKMTDLFDFAIFGKCLASIQKMNRKEQFYYVGFQYVEDDEDDGLNEKVLNCMSHSLKDVDIYCCNNKAEPELSFNDSLASN